MLEKILASFDAAKLETALSLCYGLRISGNRAVNYANISKQFSSLDSTICKIFLRAICKTKLEFKERRLWKEEDEELLRLLHSYSYVVEEYLSTYKIAQLLHRSTEAVKKRITLLNLDQPEANVHYFEEHINITLEAISNVGKSKIEQRQSSADLLNLEWFFENMNMNLFSRLIFLLYLLKTCSPSARMDIFPIIKRLITSQALNLFSSTGIGLYEGRKWTADEDELLKEFGTGSFKLRHFQDMWQRSERALSSHLRRVRRGSTDKEAIEARETLFFDHVSRYKEYKTQYSQWRREFTQFLQEKLRDYSFWQVKYENKPGMLIYYALGPFKKLDHILVDGQEATAISLRNFLAKSGIIKGFNNRDFEELLIMNQNRNLIIEA